MGMVTKTALLRSVICLFVLKRNKGMRKCPEKCDGQGLLLLFLLYEK